MNDSRKKQVVVAFEAEDERAIRRLGWYPVWEAVDWWWRPRFRCSMKQFAPLYAKLLGDEDPAKVLEAFRENCGEYRPTAAHIRGHLHRPKVAEPKHNAPCRSPFLNGPAVAAVADARKAGERECACGWHPSRFQHDQADVLRCRDCRGLEPGQVGAAEDAGLLDGEAA